MALGIIICVVFLIMAALMMTKKMPTLLALPIMAVLIALIAGMPVNSGDENLFKTVIAGGSTKLAGTYIAILIACWLSQIMSHTGVTNTVIKKAAELGGDKPFIVAELMCIVTLVLFTVLMGTGAVVMVGTIVLPILLSVGVPPIVASNIFLCGVSGGYILNPANMSGLINITGITQSDLTMCAVVVAVGEVVFLTTELIVTFKKNGKKYAFAAPVKEEETPDDEPETLHGFRGFMACITPVVIVILALVFKLDAIVCFFIGIIWIIIFTIHGKWSKYMSMITKSCYDGFKDGAPAAILFVGIGMLLAAVTAKVTQTALNPFMTAITPKTAIGFVIFAAILCPLSLYRGPFNIFGLGSGLAASIIGLGTLPVKLVATVFYACTRWPAQAGPTATQVVWTSSFVGYDPVTTTNKIQPANWIFTAITIIIMALLYT